MQLLIQFLGYGRMGDGVKLNKLKDIARVVTWADPKSQTKTAFVYE